MEKAAFHLKQKVTCHKQVSGNKLNKLFLNLQFLFTKSINMKYCVGFEILAAVARKRNILCDI
jgi:hypothetical protein